MECWEVLKKSIRVSQIGQICGSKIGEGACSPGKQMKCIVLSSNVALHDKRLKEIGASAAHHLISSIARKAMDSLGHS